MKTLLGKRLGLVGIFAASLAVSFPAEAAFKLTIADSAVGGSKVAVADKDGGDNVQALARSIAFLGPSIPDWAGSFDLARSRGGSPAFLALRGSVDPSESDAANLIITLADADFTGAPLSPAPINLDFSASRSDTSGVRTADLYVDDANAEFGSGTSSVGPQLAANQVDFTVPGQSVTGLADPFSKSMNMLVAYDAKSAASSETTTRIAPIPGSLVLFGSALLGLVLTGRFGRHANTTA
jgi:hypothetical protein